MKHDTILKDKVKKGIKQFIVIFIILFIILAFLSFYSMSIYGLIKNTYYTISSYFILQLGQKMYDTIVISVMFASLATLLLNTPDDESGDIEDDDESGDIEDEDYLEVPEEFVGRESEYWKRYYKAFPELCED